MYFSHTTETVLSILTACACKPDCSFASWEIAEPGSVCTEKIEKCSLLLVRLETLWFGMGESRPRRQD